MIVWRRLYSCLLVGSALGLTAPGSSKADQSAPGRFTTLPGFKVEEVVTPGTTGSLLAMTFNEAGDILATRGGEEIILVSDKDHDGHFESVSTFSDKVKGPLGLLALHGRVFAVGDGPSGTGLYRLTDTDDDGDADTIDTLFKFRGGMGEHGPHAVTLGPDGMLYVMIGNHANIEPAAAATSPHHDYYEGDLIEPKYEDARGHAVGIKAPGGTVVRTTENGSPIELFVGGFRNAYDHAFNRAGDLFTYDSDMEWDIGLPWYRPTRVNHLIPGAEYGWRSGWSPWPAYYVDSLPEVVDMDRGSPTGLEFYEHTRFPEKYRGALFMCDWSQGRVVAVTLRRAGATYAAQTEVFVEGRPLNCSDIAVGPDGWLYICAGGRVTEGSIFRVVADGAANVPLVPTNAKQEESPAWRAVHYPQMYAAWARRAIATLQGEAGARWVPDLTAIAEDVHALPDDRTRALDLLQIFSPPPTETLLVKLTHDDAVAVRNKATYLLGLHAKAAAGARLVELLDDVDPGVRRTACESLVRSRQTGPAAKLVALLADNDRFVAWAARRAIETLPRDQWQATVLESTNPRTFIVGSVALLTLNQDRASNERILRRSADWLKDKTLTEVNLVDLLRVIELALYRVGSEGSDAAPLRELLSARYPAGDWQANRELVRLLVRLQEPTLAPRLIGQLDSDIPLTEKIHAAMVARFLQAGWTPELRTKLLRFYDVARAAPGGGNSYGGYLSNAANDFVKSGSSAEQIERLVQGAKAPGTTLGLVQGLSHSPEPDQCAALRTLDRTLDVNRSHDARQLSKAVLCVLARGDLPSKDYLREVFDAKPERRQDVAVAIATAGPPKQPHENDRDLLVRSLTVVEGAAARDVLATLAKYPKLDVTPEVLRQVILLGLKLRDQGAREAAALLGHWTGEAPYQGNTVADAAIVAWQKWFTEKYPDLPEPTLPKEPVGNTWKFDQLMEFLASDKGAAGDRNRGVAIFEKAQCIKCHRYGNRGEGVGPDLSNVSKRFQRKEILESVIFPSQVISDQFAAKKVLTVEGKTYEGLVGPAGDGIVVVQANAEKVTIPNSEVDEVVASRTSAMPEGLFNLLTLEEIADLFAYLGEPAQP